MGLIRSASSVRNLNDWKMGITGLSGNRFKIEREREERLEFISVNVRHLPFTEGKRRK